MKVLCILLKRTQTIWLPVDHDVLLLPVVKSSVLLWFNKDWELMISSQLLFARKMVLSGVNLIFYGKKNWKNTVFLVQSVLDLMEKFSSLEQEQ